jgi:thiol-disulfide isomerase/thioredoxin
MKKNIKLALTIILIVLVIVLLDVRFGKGKKQASESLGQVQSMSFEEKSTKYLQAKEITTPDYYINSEEFLLEDYVGDKVVLIDFWTYSCINCQRTFPYLNEWHRKYEDEGLLIVGIHTPEFEFEKKYENVQDAVERFEIEFPVIMDNDFSTWRSYENRYWPRKYLIDIDGFIVYDHAGEGAYVETERKIVELLNERKVKLGEEMLEFNPFLFENDKESKGDKTSEIYFGTDRLKHVSVDSETLVMCEVEESCSLSFPQQLLKDTFAPIGEWKFEPEYIENVNNDASLVLQFQGQGVNLVAEASGKPVTVTVEVYDIDQNISTKEVVIDGAGLYNLVELDKNQTGSLTLTFDNSVKLYTFTFD